MNIFYIILISYIIISIIINMFIYFGAIRNAPLYPDEYDRPIITDENGNII